MKNDILLALIFMRDRLFKENKFGYSASFNDTFKSFKKYTGKSKGITFEEVDQNWLNGYQAWMLKMGKGSGLPASISTVSIYLRSVRVVFNEAIKQKVIPDQVYPFGSKLFSIPQASNPKKALSSEDLKKVLEFVPSTKYDRLFLGLWKLSYFCNGMNMADLLNLEWNAFSGDSFTFVRRKTAGRVKSLESICVSIPKPAIQILSEIGTDVKTGYVLPFIKSHMTDIEKDKQVSVVIATINRLMKKIGKELGIKAVLSTSAARHSFSTMLMRKSVPLAFISKSLGHRSISTTQHYLAGFEDDKTQEYMKLLEI